MPGLTLPEHEALQIPVRFKLLFDMDGLPSPAGGSQAPELTSWSPVHHQGLGQPPPPRSKPMGLQAVGSPLPRLA